MVRIAGIDLPRRKRIDIGLTSVFGIGRISAKNIINETTINPSTRCENLTDEEVSQLRTLIENNYKTEGDLRREYSQNIKRLTEIGSAKGRRHRVGLPVRGQRTRTNARTRKGKVKIAVSRKR